MTLTPTKKSRIINLVPTIITAISFFVFTSILPACYYDNEADLYPSLPANCDTSNIPFANYIQPLLENHCIVCHSGDGSLSGGILFEAYEQIKTQVDNGSFLGAISHSSGFPEMPQGGDKLPACDLYKIEMWINAGAPNN